MMKRNKPYFYETCTVKFSICLSSIFIIFLMFFILFGILGKSYGFSRIELVRDSYLKYDISKDDFYFSIQFQSDSGLKMEVNIGENSTIYEDFQPYRFYKVEGDSVIFTTTQKSIFLNVLELERGTCGNVTLTVNIESYIQINTFQIAPQENYCLFFYQPGNSYRVFSDCQSDDINTVCFLMSAADIESGNERRCRANSTCDGSLNDGFLITGYGQGSKYLNVSTRIILMKGNVHNNYCGYRSVDLFDGSPNATHFNGSIVNNYVCQMGSLHIGLAVSLVAVMFFIIICGFLMYYLCRPNREAYESSSDILKKKKGKSKNKNKLSSGNYSSHGFDAPLIGPQHL